VHFREDFLTANGREWPRMNAKSRGEETAALPIRVDWRPFAVPFSFRLFGLFRGFPFGCGSAAPGLCVLKSSVFLRDAGSNGKRKYQAVDGVLFI